MSVSANIIQLLVQMGLANTLPLSDGIPGIISSFVGRTCSVAADCGMDADIANMDDVSDELIDILTKERFDSEFILANMGSHSLELWARIYLEHFG